MTETTKILLDIEPSFLASLKYREHMMKGMLYNEMGILKKKQCECFYFEFKEMKITI